MSQHCTQTRKQTHPRWRTHDPTSHSRPEKRKECHICSHYRTKKTQRTIIGEKMVPLDNKVREIRWEQQHPPPSEPFHANLKEQDFRAKTLAKYRGTNAFSPKAIQNKRKVETQLTYQNQSNRPYILSAMCKRTFQTIGFKSSDTLRKIWANPKSNWHCACKIRRNLNDPPPPLSMLVDLCGSAVVSWLPNIVWGGGGVVWHRGGVSWNP